MKKTMLLMLLVIGFHHAPAQTITQKTNDMTHQMILSKTINAPVETVWKAWSSEELVKQWWGPGGFTAAVADIQFKEGGVSLVSMRSAEGFEIFTSWTYTKISPMTSIEFVQHFTDKNGKKIKPTDIGLPPGIPEAVPHIISLEDLGNGQTKMTITESGYTNLQIVEISRMGMQQTLDKMERVLLEKRAACKIPCQKIF